MNLTIEPYLEPVEDTTSTTSVLPRILIVDDEAGIRDFIAEVLNETDYIAEAAVNGDIALKKLRDDHYDLLLVDYHMPRMTGCELISEMRAAGIHIPVVLMTGHCGELMAYHPDLQVNAILEKPFLIHELMGILASVLSPASDTAMINLADVHESRRTCFF